MTSNTVRIALDQARIGMVSAENIYSPTGLKLIDRGDAITQSHLFRLKLYQVFYFTVYTVNQFSENNTHIETKKDLKELESNAYFKQFKKHYIEAISNLNVLIYSLREGKEVSNELYECCISLLSYLPDKTDLFLYLYHIDSKTYKEATLIHGLNVGILCSIVGEWLNLSPNEIKELTLAGLLHDIGKFNISNDIINKPGRLTSGEFEIIKTHPVSGYEDVKKIALPYGSKMAILQHHEKIDGSGYPYGFKDAQIHEYAKIVAILDIYDAMTSDRMYHRRFSPFCVISFLEEEGQGLLDANYLSCFLENLAMLYTGKTVLLSNGDTAKIVSINRKLPSRPLVQVGSKIYNLEFELSLNIVDII